MDRRPCTASRSNDSMSSTSTCRSYNCASVQDECLFHTSIEGHNLYAGPNGENIQLHVLRRSEYPHTPYIYCYSGEEYDNYFEFPAYQPAVAAQSSDSITTKASSFTVHTGDHPVVEILYDYDFGNVNYEKGRRIELFLLRPSWSQKTVNLALRFKAQADAITFLRHLLGGIKFESAGETSCLVFEPKSFRLGKVGQMYPPHEGQRDQSSSIEIYKDVNERRRMCFTGSEGRCFSGWMHGHPTSPRKPATMDMVMNVQVNLVAQRVHAATFKQTATDLQQAMYLPKFKVYVESQMDIYFQDITEEATDFSRVASEFIHGQVLFEREVDFVFKTNYGLREEEKKDATMYLAHRSSGDWSFQHRLRPNLWRKSRGGTSINSDESMDFEQPCAMVMYLRFNDWAHVAEISKCTVRRDNIDPCTIMLSGQPPYPRRVRIGENHSDSFPYWPLDDYLQQEDSFQISRIRFRTKEEAELFLRQKDVLQPSTCFLCRTRHKRNLAAHLPPNDIHASLKTCLISSLATVSLISFQTEDVESSQLIHPFSHTVKKFLNKHRTSIKAGSG